MEHTDSAEDAATRPRDGARRERLARRVHQCLALLDLVDSHIVMSLQTFSTSIDVALERLRTDLETLENAATPRPPTAAPPPAEHVAQRIRICQGSLGSVKDRLYQLGIAADAVRCALVYISAELDLLATEFSAAGRDRHDATRG